jgi:hypothetical protein
VLTFNPVLQGDVMGFALRIEGLYWEGFCEYSPENTGHL